MNPLYSGLLWATVQSTLICVLLIALSYATRGRRPHEMTAAIVSGYVACWILSLIAFVPSVHWSWSLPQLRSQITKNSPILAGEKKSQESEGELLEIEKASPVPDVPLAWKQEIRRWLGRNFDQFERTLSPAVNHREKSKPTMDWIELVAMILVSFGCVWWTACFWWVYHVVGQSKPIHDDRIAVLTNEMRTQQRFCGRVLMRESSYVSIGGTIGIFSNYILLNPSWREWTPIQLRAVLAHEIAHVSRRDFCWVLLGSLTRAVFFYNPLIHTLFGRMRLEQEFAADGIAANLVGNAKAYGRALAELALCQNSKRDHRIDPVLMASGKDLVWRISMLSQGRFSRKQPTRWLIGIAIVVWIGIAPLTGLRSIGSPGFAQLDEVCEAVDGGASQDATKTSNAPDKSQEQLQLEEVRKAFPPLEIKGKLLFRPGRTGPNQVNPRIATWIEYASIVVLGLKPSDESLMVGTTTTRVSHTDMNREGGRLDQSADIKEAYGFKPGTLINSPLLPFLTSQLGSPVLKDEFRGHQLVGLRATRSDDAPTLWMVDDHAGFHVGTREEIEKILAQETSPANEETQESWALGSEYSKVILGVYCNEMGQLGDEFQRFIEGTKHQETLENLSVKKVLDGMSQLSIVLSEEFPNALKINLRYASDADAAVASKIVQSWIQMLPIALMASGIELDESQSMLRQVLKGENLSVEMDPQWLHKLALMDSSHASDDPKQWNSLGLTRFKKVDDGIQRVPPETTLMSKEGLVQSIDAVPYRGKRIRLRSVVSDATTRESYAGILLATAGSQSNLLNFQSRSMDGNSNLIKLLSGEDIIANRNVNAAVVTIDMDVPMDACSITFGYYGDSFKIQNEVVIRSFEIETVESNSSEQKIQQLPWHSDIFSIATRDQIERKPINMDFQLWSDPTEEPSRVAQVPDETAIR